MNRILAVVALVAAIAFVIYGVSAKRKPDEKWPLTAGTARGL
jgi:cytochrome c oxidase assembly factor CtaG